MAEANGRDAHEAAHNAVLQPHSGNLPQQQQQQQPRYLAKGRAATRPDLSRPLSAQNSRYAARPGRERAMLKLVYFSPVVDWSLESNAMFLPLSLPFSPLLARSFCVPRRSSRYVLLRHLGCARKTDSPAVLYSAAKGSLPSLLGGGNGSTLLPPLPDSGPSSEGLRDEGDRRAADGNIHNYAGLDS